MEKGGDVFAHRSNCGGAHSQSSFPIVYIREIKLLQKLNHKNVVKLKEVVSDAIGARFLLDCSVYYPTVCCESLSNLF